MQLYKATATLMYYRHCKCAHITTSTSAVEDRKTYSKQPASHNNNSGTWRKGGHCKSLRAEQLPAKPYCKQNMTWLILRPEHTSGKTRGALSAEKRCCSGATTPDCGERIHFGLLHGSTKAHIAPTRCILGGHANFSQKLLLKGSRGLGCASLTKLTCRE